jgi:hypothetical protein
MKEGSRLKEIKNCREGLLNKSLELNECSIGTENYGRIYEKFKT